jgi:hypothetical protein
MRIDEALGVRRAVGVDDAPHALLATAEELLRDLLHRDSAGRDSALDLLTVDALVTYAFEAAASDPSALAARAESASARFARVATESFPIPDTIS